MAEWTKNHMSLSLLQHHLSSWTQYQICILLNLAKDITLTGNHKTHVCTRWLQLNFHASNPQDVLLLNAQICSSKSTSVPHPPPEMFIKISGLYLKFVCVCVCVCAKSLRSCPTLCNPVDCSPPSSSVHGVLQARTMEWVVISYSRVSSWPRDQDCISYVSCIGRWVLYH